MSFTAPQLKLLREAGMSRRDFLKFLGKTAAVAGGAPIEKLAKLAGTGRVLNTAKGLPLGTTGVKIEFFPEGLNTQSNISGALNVIANGFKAFKALLSGGDVHDIYDYGQYMYYTRANVDFDELAKKWGLNAVDSRDEEGIWYANTEFGGLQVTQVDTWNKRWDHNEPSTIQDWDEQVLNPIKDYWDKVRRDTIWSSREEIDREGLEKLEENGVDVNDTQQEMQRKLESDAKWKKEHLDRNREQEEKTLQDKEMQARLGELGGELDYIKKIDRVLGTN